MMREIDTEQPVVWPEWCYNTNTGESRTAASPASSSVDQKGCGIATMSHSSSSSNKTHSPSGLPPPSAAENGPLVNALNGHPGLSFLTTQMAMSANKLLQLAQKHQQQQNYRPSPPPTNVVNVQQQQQQQHNHQTGGGGVKRKKLESAVALLSDRLSPTSSANNNNSFSVNNLNFEKLAHRINGNSQPTGESNYLPKNLTAKDFNSCSNNRASSPTTIKSERISPINFHNGKAANGRSSLANAGGGSASGRSRSSTPSSSSVVFNLSSTSSSVSNNGSTNGTLGLNSNGTGQQQQQPYRNGSSSLGELSLSRLNHHQLSDHHQPTFGQQLPESRISGSTTTAENLQQSMARSGEPQTRNYSDMIRSLAAKYHNSTAENNNGQLIATHGTGGQRQQQAAHQRFNSSSRHNIMRDPEAPSPLSSAAAAMRLLSSSHSGQVNSKQSKSRSPAVAVPSAPNKASLHNPSLAASLAAHNPPPHDHSKTTKTAAGQSDLISSFLTGLPASMFTPMIDMTSTQALVTLARAAKEAEFLNLLSSSPSSSSPSSVASPRTNGGSPSSAVAARKRLQTTRSVLNATAMTPIQKATGRVNSLLGNGDFPGAAVPANATSLAPSPPNMSLSASLLAAVASNSSTNGRNLSLPMNLHSVATAGNSAPLDLSAGPQQQHTVADVEDEQPQMKRVKIERQLSPSFSPGPDSGIGEMIGGRDASGGSSSDSESPVRSPRQSMDKWATGCNHQAEIDEMRSWSVQQVCEFVSSIDICAEYAKNFQEQSIDGTGLPLLTEEHLRNLLSMKLGPALKLMAILAARMGVKCEKCGDQRTSGPPNDVSSSPAESLMLSQSAVGTAAGRRSESPPVKMQLNNEAFVSFRTKIESLSPIYNSGEEGATNTCEGMIATVTMTAAPSGRSTPNGGSREELPAGQDIPMKVEHLLSGADR